MSLLPAAHPPSTPAAGPRRAAAAEAPRPTPPAGRRLGLTALVLMAGALSGCVVLPWGPGRHHGHGRGHYAEPDRGAGHGRSDRPHDQRLDDRWGR